MIYQNFNKLLYLVLFSLCKSLARITTQLVVCSTKLKNPVRILIYQTWAIVLQKRFYFSVRDKMMLIIIYLTVWQALPRFFLFPFIITIHLIIKQVLKGRKEKKIVWKNGTQILWEFGCWKETEFNCLVFPLIPS